MFVLDTQFSYRKCLEAQNRFNFQNQSFGAETDCLYLLPVDAMDMIKTAFCCKEDGQNGDLACSDLDLLFTSKLVVGSEGHLRLQCQPSLGTVT